MTYSQLLQQYKDSLRAAATLYEAPYLLAKKNLPHERAHDLAQLRQLWEVSDDHTKMVRQTQAICEGFKTGWLWGRRSTLKDSVLAILELPNYREEHFMQALKHDNQALRTQLSRTVTRSGHSGNLAKLQAQVRSLLAKNTQLEEDNAQLVAENKQLKKTVSDIQAANDKFALQLKNLNRRLLKLEAERTPDPEFAEKECSPSESILSGFQSLASMAS